MQRMVGSVSQARQLLSFRRIATALVMVVCLAAPVAGAAGGPASSGLSTEANADSIGLTESGVHAQTGPLVAANGSVTINETRTNRTQAVLDSVTLPQNGYIVARTGNVSANQSPGTVVGHTQYVRNGTFNEVVLDLNKSVQGSQTLSVALYNDTNGDETLNITGNGTTDAPYRTANGTPLRDSVQLGENRSENATSTNATVTLSNQTTNGSTVTVQSVTLSEPGFVTLHTSSYADDLVGPNESVIAVSQRLAAGTHHNVTIDVSHAPPGNAPGLNRSQVNETGTLAVVVYGDSNANDRLDSVRSLGQNDTIITNNGSVVSDTARVRVPSPPRQTASVGIKNQTLQQQAQQNTLVVDRARLPDGGFLVALNASYRQSGDPLTSVVGVSDYLSSGNHTNVTLDVRPGDLNRTQTITIQPARDTNDNKQYDFVTSSGFQDVGYETLNRSGVITDSAQVRVPSSDRPQSQSARQTPTANPASGTVATTADGPKGSSGGLFGGFGLAEVVGVLVVALGVGLVTREVR